MEIMSLEITSLKKKSASCLGAVLLPEKQEDLGRKKGRFSLPRLQIKTRLCSLLLIVPIFNFETYNLAQYADIAGCQRCIIPSE